MNPSETVALTRECDATAVPAGTKVSLPAGTMVTITQTLGGSFSVVTDRGFMVRIEASDADALGKEAGGDAAPSSTAGWSPASETDLESKVWEELRTVFDPEIPVNIVDLGLVYSLHVVDAGEGRYDVDVDMSMTAPGCGMGDVLTMDAQSKIAVLPGVREAAVHLVWEPAWDQSLMSDAARLQLGMD